MYEKSGTIGPSPIHKINSFLLMYFSTQPQAWLEVHSDDDVPQMLGHDATDYFKLRRPTGMHFNFKSVKEVTT
jgi:hypothetical protein